MQVSSFAHKLAHTEKRVRDKAFNKLVQFIASQTNEIPKVTWMKLSKAIFYCYWMSDKRPVQLFLSTRIASLIESLEKNQASAFRACFIHVIIREWPGIDSHRLDKFYLLLRQIINHSFKLCQKLEWTRSVCLEFVESLKFGQVCDGLQYHFISCFFEECSVQLPNDAAALFFHEFAALAAKTESNTVRTMICEEVFGRVDELDCLKSVDKKHLVRAIWEVASDIDCTHAGRKILYKTAETLAASSDVDLADLIAMKQKEVIDINPEPMQLEPSLIEKRLTDFPSNTNFKVPIESKKSSLKMKKKKKKDSAKQEETPKKLEDDASLEVELPISVIDSAENSSLLQKPLKGKAKDKAKKPKENKLEELEPSNDLSKSKSVNFNLEANKTKLFHKKNSITTPAEVKAAKADSNIALAAPKAALKRSAGDLQPQRTKKAKAATKKDGKKNKRPVAADYM